MQIIPDTSQSPSSTETNTVGRGVSMYILPVRKLETYRIPIAKTMETPIRLPVGICNDQMIFCGNRKFTTSETKLIAAVATKKTRLSKQWPPGTVKSQIFLCGMHERFDRMTTEEYHNTLIHIIRWHDQKNVLRAPFGTRIRSQSSRIATFENMMPSP
jgi:hypothetical protein